jgi:K+/H+ antiporter YhaU regulatory subunit KhtT
MVLLQDTNIVDVSPGSGIEVRSRAAAWKFIEKFKDMNSINSLKNSISEIIEEKRRLEDDLKIYVDKLVDYSERFKKSNPFAILEIEIPSSSKLLGKNIGEVNFWQNTGATIIGIRRNKHIILSPGPYAEFLEDDVFVMVGDEGSYERTKKFIYE